MFLRGTYCTNTPEKGRSVAQCNPFTTITWYHLAWGELDGTGNSLRSFPWRGAQGLWWLLSAALSMGSGVLFLTVVLSWRQPKTLPCWHMLVGEERTERVTKQTGK